MNSIINNLKIDILNHIHAGVLYCKNDSYSTILYANDYFYTMLGYTRCEIEILFNNQFSKLVVDDVSSFLSTLDKKIENNEDLDFEYRMRKKNNDIIWVHDTAKYDKENNCWYVTIMDITENKRIEKEKQQLEFYLNNMPNKIVILDNHENIIYKNYHAKSCNYYNQNAIKFKDFIGNNILDQQYEDIIHQAYNGNKVTYETRYRNDELTFIGHDINYLIPIRSDSMINLTYMQISEDLLSHGDNITHFPTRNMFEAYFYKYLIKNPTSSVYICMVDIDKFKSINDTYGHIIGDKLIQLTAIKLNKILGFSDYICRYGGDEFIIMFVNQSKDDIISKCEYLLNSTKSPIIIDEQKINISYSIGIAKVFNVDYESSIKNADTALYEVKSHGRNNYLFFNE